MTYIFKINFPDTDKGTKLFFQDGMYYYKNRTEHDRWLSRDYVENNPDLFEQQ